MRRKLISQRGSYTITLPKSWAVANHLKHGDEVNVNEIRGLLVINSPDTSYDKACTYDITTYSPVFLRNLLNQLYINNYTKITLNSTNRKQLTLARKLMSLFLVGFECTTNKKDTITLELLVNLRESDFEKYFSKLISATNHIIEVSGTGERKRVTKKATQYKNICRRLLFNAVKEPRDRIRAEIASLLCEVVHILFHKPKTSERNQRCLKLIVHGLRTKDIESVRQAQELIDGATTMQRTLYGLSNAVLQLTVLDA